MRTGAHKWLRWFGIAGILFVACAPHAGTEARGLPSNAVDSPPFNWDDPFNGKGIFVASFAEAEQQTGFEAIEPQGLGSPAGVDVSPHSEGNEASALYLIYDHPKYGRILVGESAPDSPHEEDRLAYYESAVESNGDPNKLGTNEMLPIRGGIPALVALSAERIAAIEWVEGETQFFVVGPQLTRDQVVEIVELI